MLHQIRLSIVTAVVGLFLQGELRAQVAPPPAVEEDWTTPASHVKTAINLFGTEVSDGDLAPEYLALYRQELPKSRKLLGKDQIPKAIQLLGTEIDEREKFIAYIVSCEMQLAQAGPTVEDVRLNLRRQRLTAQYVRDALVGERRRCTEELSQRPDAIIPDIRTQTLDEYVDNSLLFGLGGTYTGATPSLGGIGVSVGAGILGVDLPKDIVDLLVGFNNWEWSWEHAGNQALNGIALVPVIGSVKNIKNGVKYGDDVADEIKYIDDALEELNSPIWSSTKDLSSAENAFKHFKDHRTEFPEYKNALEYTNGAHSFVNNPPVGTLTQTRPKNGDILFYNPMTNTFAVQAANGAPRTMFKPRDGIKYWNDQKVKK